jgi:multiple sugar transport system permease protein
MAQTDGALIAPSQINTRVGHRRKFWSTDNPWFWLSPAILFLLAYSIFPLLYNLFISFNEWQIRKKVFVGVGLDNWVKLLGDERAWNAARVTFTYTVIALAVELCLGMTIALLLDSRPWGVGLMQTLIILPMVTAPAVTGMLFRLLEHSDFGVISWVLYGLGLLNKNEPLLGGTGKYALAGVLIADIWQWTPFFVLIILSGLKALPDEVIEASQVDGASWWQRLWRIKIPLLQKVLSIAILFRLVDLFKVFDYVFIMTAGGPALKTETLSFYGYINTFSTIKWGYGATLGLTIMVLGWIMAYVYQKLFRLKW